MVALGDFDLALKLEDERPLCAPHAVGNVMWRSPEGQSGKGVAKPSDIYSFGLVVSDTHTFHPALERTHTNLTDQSDVIHSAPTALEEALY
jgi:serine/threonine protein kinase